MSGINITDDQIAKWRSRMGEIDTELTRLSDEKAHIQATLAAVDTLAQRLGKASAPSQADATLGDGGLTLIDAIPSVLRKHGKPMKPGEIKSRLGEVGFTQAFAASYFYTAIQRAVQKKSITPLADKTYAFNPAYANGAH